MEIVFVCMLEGRRRGEEEVDGRGEEMEGRKKVGN